MMRFLIDHQSTKNGFSALLFAPFDGANVFKLGVYDAVAHFNIGGRVTVEILEGLGMNPGALCLAGLQQTDSHHVSRANYKSPDIVKTCRKFVRGKRKRQGDKNQEREGETYSAESF